MACSLVNISAQTDCNANQGGIVKSFITSFENITSVTITSGVISNFTMASTGLWVEYDYTKDASANFAQVGTLNGNRSTVEQTAFMKFGGLSAAYVAAANNAKDCCQLVAVHVLANGVRLVQGIESQSATGAPASSANRNTRIAVSMLTDTSQNEARMEFTMAGNQNTFALTTSLSDSAILAL